MSADRQKPYAQHIGVGWALLAILVLLVALFYTLIYAFFTPYPGVDFDGRWNVFAFDSPCDTDPGWCERRDASLKVGDRMLIIGDLTYERYRSGSNGIPFWRLKPGETVPIVYERDGEIWQTTWEVLGPTAAARSTRLMGLLTYLPFWLAGTGVLFFIRPRDRVWRLLVAFNYVIALWIAAGVPSCYRIAASEIALGALTSVLVPVFLHLHLLVPRPLFARAHRYLVIPLYMLSLVLVGLGLVRPFPDVVYQMLLLVAIAGSLILLLIRLPRRQPPSVRLALRLMLAGIGLAFGPAMVLYIIPGLMSSIVAGRVPIIFMTAAISLLPFFYIYALYKHRFGALEFRANRILSLFSFLVVYVTLFMLVFALGSRWVHSAAEVLAFSFVLSVLFLAAMLPLRAPFQRLIDRLAYGTVHNPDDIIRAFADEIPRALNRSDLIRLLTREVMPSLLIKQSALYLVSQDDVTLYYADDMPMDEQELASSQVQTLLATAGRFRPLEPGDRSPLAWVRLPLSIEVEEVVIGAWLLGKRDPDDFYPMRDIDLLATLANQVGVALETSRALSRLQDRATELERAYSELQELDRLKDEFVENISHELRTPLTFVRGYSELMLEGAMGELGDEQRETLEEITGWTDAVIRMVNDIINIQQGALERLEPEPVNIVALVRSCVAAAEMLAGQAPGDRPAHAFSITVGGDVPVVWGDRGRLRQVLDNLLENATKFSPRGGAVTVHVGPRPYRFGDGDDTPQPAVEISVKDQGVGIPGQQLDRIWERFYKVDGSSTREFGGLGLGLAIVRAIVHAHRGAIWAESEAGQGSTFHVLLPVKTQPAVQSPEGRGPLRDLVVGT